MITLNITGVFASVLLLFTSASNMPVDKTTPLQRLGVAVRSPLPERIVRIHATFARGSDWFQGNPRGHTMTLQTFVSIRCNRCGVTSPREKEELARESGRYCLVCGEEFEQVTQV